MTGEVTDEHVCLPLFSCGTDGSMPGNRPTPRENRQIMLANSDTSGKLDLSVVFDSHCHNEIIIDPLAFDALMSLFRAS